MTTEIIKVCEEDADFSVKLSRAANIIKSGGLVVFPTETVYGLGGDATNSAAAKKIYEAKGRPSDNPLIIHISSPEEAEEYTYTNEVYYKLAEMFMPGPITVILKAKEERIPKETRGGLDTVAVRCPVNPVARRLIELSGVPIAAPSANISGKPSPTAPQHVINDMTGRVDMIIDGGECDIGIESTIVKIDDGGALTLLRPGEITVEQLSAAGLSVKVADAVVSELGKDEVALSPGMKYRHYAPKSPVILLDGDIDKCALYIKERAEKRVGILCYSDEVEFYSRALPYACIYDFGDKHSQAEQARLLFSLLRDADMEDLDVIYAPIPTKNGIGLALYNRMIRAAAHKIIRL